MANDLTGDFDVVAEFTIDAANRVLAAMHSGNRFPHSWSLRVDDNPQSKRVARSIVDVFGDAVTDPVLVNAVALAPGSLRGLSSSDPIYQQVEPVVNANHPRFGFAPALGDFGHLKGIAQLQLGPPTITLPDDSGTTVTVHTPVMARYIGDSETMPIPEFLRGEIQTTLSESEVSSPAGTFIDVNLVRLGGNIGNIHFIQSWPHQPLSAQQLNAINKALRNSLITSFQPSSTPIPSNVLDMRLKTMPGDSPALAVLMDLPGGVLAGEVIGAAFGLDAPPPDPGSVTTVFLGDSDDFAIAVRSDDIVMPFASAVNTVLNNLPPISFTTTVTLHSDIIGDYYSFTITTAVSIGTATVELQDAAVGGGILGAINAAVNAAIAAAAHCTGQILLTIPVHVHFTTDSSYIPAPNDLDFTISQAFYLKLDGGEVSLETLGGVSVDIPSSVPGNIADKVRGKARDAFNNAWNNASGQIQPKVSSMLSVDNLQGFLQLLMNPVPNPSKPKGQPVQEVDPQLAYTSIEIKPAGVILHGTLEVVPAWPSVQVEFDLSAGTPGAASPEYSALKTWIPGGTIQEYIWTLDGNPQPLHTDRNTFVFPDAPTPGWVPKKICLTVNGTQKTASGQVADQPVSATGGCKWISRILIDNRVPQYAGGEGGQAGHEGVPAGNQGRPDIALTQFSASGALEIVGHTSPWAPDGTSAGGTANLIVHFASEKSAAHLDFLARALRESGRTDAATAILAVLSPDQLTKIKPMDGLIFADDDRAWELLFKVKHRPATFVIGTSGEVAWHYHGELTSADLAAALKTHLVAGGRFTPRLLQSSVRIGQPTPNFIFEYASGRELTLRKLAGRPVVLVFWKSSSKASLETLRDLQKTFASAGGQGPVVLAINDGEAPELAKKVAAENGLTAIVVPDPERQISLAYGVNIWPTAMFLDALGLVKNIRFGRFSGELAKHPSQAKTAAAQSPRNTAGVPPKKTGKRRTERLRGRGRTPKE